MNQISKIIESGILELYVLGIASPEEKAEIEHLCAIYPEIRQEIDQISQAIEAYAKVNAVQPKATVKAELMATVDFIERIQNGEEISNPPILTPDSKMEDFADWINRPDMQMQDNMEGVFAKIIGANLQATTAIIWIQEMTEYEVHEKEYERFLILEGTCNFIIGDEVHSLVPGDYLAVPLNTPHMAKVTSDMPCKAILQRIAA